MVAQRCVRYPYITHTDFINAESISTTTFLNVYALLRVLNTKSSVVDDSGSWSRGGVFAALSALSPKPEQVYARAAEARPSPFIFFILLQFFVTYCIYEIFLLNFLFLVCAHARS